MDTCVKIHPDGTQETIPARQAGIGDTIIIPEEGTFTLEEAGPICMQNLRVGARYKFQGNWYQLAMWGNDVVGLPVAGVVGELLEGNCDIPHPNHNFTYLNCVEILPK